MEKRSTQKVLVEQGMRKQSAKSRLRRTNRIAEWPFWWRITERGVLSAE
jgi:hypothetical protein